MEQTNHVTPVTSPARIAMADRLKQILMRQTARNHLPRWGRIGRNDRLARLSLRDLAPDDAGRLSAFFTALPEADRAHRFCGSFCKEAIRRYVDNMNWNRAMVAGLFDGEKLIAVSELVAASDEAGAPVEFAVAVAPEWQGNGLASRLFRRALADARQRGASGLVYTCMPDNLPMIRMAHNAGGKVTHRGSECWISFPMAPRNRAARVLHTASAS